MRFPVSVPAAALLLAGTAFAEDPPPPAPEPVPAPVPAPAPAPPEKPKEEIGLSLDENRIVAPNGWVVWYYSVNFVDPKILRDELNQWKTPEAKIEPMSNATGQASNVLRIQERKENLPLLEKMLEVLDQPQPQVLVRAKL